MKNILMTTVVFALSAGMAFSQDVKTQLPEGAMKPSNLSDLGGDIRSRVSEAINGEVGDLETAESGPEGLSLFSGDKAEDPHILEIKSIARELESQRAMMIKISDLQQDLIGFAQTDASAAYQSRTPSSVCELALAPRFCDAMTGSFQKRDMITRKN